MEGVETIQGIAFKMSILLKDLHFSFSPFAFLRTNGDAWNMKAEKYGNKYSTSETLIIYKNWKKKNSTSFMIKKGRLVVPIYLFLKKYLIKNIYKKKTQIIFQVSLEKVFLIPHIVVVAETIFVYLLYLIIGRYIINGILF